MSKRAEQRGLELFPENGTDNWIARPFFVEGYEQAEQDIVSIIQSRIDEVIGDAQPSPVLRIELQELITKIKEDKR